MLFPIWKRLVTGTVPVNKKYLTGTVDACAHGGGGLVVWSNRTNSKEKEILTTFLSKLVLTVFFQWVGIETL